MRDGIFKNDLRNGDPCALYEPGIPDRLLTQVGLSTLALLLLRSAPSAHQQGAGSLYSVCDVLRLPCCRVLLTQRLETLLALWAWEHSASLTPG